MSEELEKVKPEKVTLMIHGKEREIKFGFSAWAKLEKEYGGLDKLGDLENEIEQRPFNVIPHLMFIGLVDKTPYIDEQGNAYPEVTEDNILEEYGLSDIKMITEVFNRALLGSLPKEAKKEVEAMKK